MTAPGRRLAIDYGRKRIGLALCDGLGISMRPLPPLQSTTLDADLVALKRVVAEEEIVGVVIGLPLQLDGEIGRAAQEVALFAAVLREQLKLPVDEVDERMTTKAAHALMKSAGHRHADRRPRIDSTAAMLILKTWLERRKNAPPG
ncbi:MAG: Holliday junction resolvase RuvX [Planctomycetes bacterium]|nr:Holliday junction resolvase RuvX [Planctomycetota bacterium]